MPKERESELRHLGGKALPMHSSCVKKMPTAHLKELSDFDVLLDLKNLSNEADKLAVQKLPKENGLEEWFADIMKIMEKIMDCKKIEDVRQDLVPPTIKTYLNVEDKNPSTPPKVSAPDEITSVTKEVNPVLKMVGMSDSKLKTPYVKEVTPDTQPVTSDTQMKTPATAVRKNVNPFVLLHQINYQETNSKENSVKNNHIKSQTAMQTPVLNRTFDKVNGTLVINSGSAAYSNPNSTSILACDSAKSGFKKTVLSSKKKENEPSSNYKMTTRSGSKRKSSEFRSTSHKKQKMDSVNQESVKVLSKASQSRRPLRDLKPSVLTSENKTKLSALIKPPQQQKQFLVLKEQLILEELKKKEKKVEENLQRVKAERQQKAEENKKNSEEKRTKTLQKRLQMEKEKEEKREMKVKKTKVKANKENPKKTTRAKELVEQHAKEKKSSLVTTTFISDVPKTPVNNKSEDFDSYELTPLPDSSTYNFSDEEEERPSTKRIPQWAQAMLLKFALIAQYYNPVNTDEIFGSVVDSPNLVQIFNINKKRYFKRTSSAIWNHTPPNQSFQH